jgi:hypothetical protein
MGNTSPTPANYNIEIPRNAAAKRVKHEWALKITM